MYVWHVCMCVNLHVYLPSSIPTPQPGLMCPMFDAKGKAVGNTSVVFVSQATARAGIGQRLGLSKSVEPVV